MCIIGLGVETSANQQRMYLSGSSPRMGDYRFHRYIDINGELDESHLGLHRPLVDTAMTLVRQHTRDSGAKDIHTRVHSLVHRIIRPSRNDNLSPDYNQAEETLFSPVTHRTLFS